MIKEFRDSGRWNGEIEKLAEQGARYVAAQTTDKRTKYAIVLDVDDTALSSYPYALPGDFARVSLEWSKWASRGECPANESILKLFRSAREKGVAVFFVSERSEELREATVKNLEAAGYGGFEGIYTMPKGYNDPSVVPFKSGVRSHIEQQGFRIVLNVGDQDSDLEGGHAQKALKLPNPMYYIK